MYRTYSFVKTQMNKYSVQWLTMKEVCGLCLPIWRLEWLYICMYAIKETWWQHRKDAWFNLYFYDCVRQSYKSSFTKDAISLKKPVLQIAVARLQNVIIHLYTNYNMKTLVTPFMNCHWFINCLKAGVSRTAHQL